MTRTPPWFLLVLCSRWPSPHTAQTVSSPSQGGGPHTCVCSAVLSWRFVCRTSCFPGVFVSNRKETGLDLATVARQEQKDTAHAARGDTNSHTPNPALAQRQRVKHTNTNKGAEETQTHAATSPAPKLVNDCSCLCHIFLQWWFVVFGMCLGSLLLRLVLAPLQLTSLYADMLC